MVVSLHCFSTTSCRFNGESLFHVKIFHRQPVSLSGDHFSTRVIFSDNLSPQRMIIVLIECFCQKNRVFVRILVDGFIQTKNGNKKLPLRTDRKQLDVVFVKFSLVYQYSGTNRVTSTFSLKPWLKVLFLVM